MLKKLFRKIMILTIIMLISITFVYADAQNSQNVYVIPIKGEINPATMQFIKSSVERAVNDPNSVALIFEIDTLGGMIDQATKIRDIIMKAPLKTVSFVNNRAESAGVLLAIASENFVMANGSTIGSAETVPFTEKNISYWKSELRSTAQQRGRDPRIVEAMADRRIEIVDPQDKNKFIVREGELLNLTTKEAERIGFVDYVENTYEDILETLNIEYTDIIIVEQDFKVKIAQAVSSSVILPILLSLGFIGLLIEILTPGFGVGGTIGLIAFVIFFGGSILAGNATTAIVLIFVTGILLLFIEAIVPGFGAPGLGGVICIIVSIILAADSVALGISSLLIALLFTVIAAVLLLKYAPRNRFFDRIILGAELTKDEGFTSIISKNNLLGVEGVAFTSLRPSGTVLINDERVDVVTGGEYVEKDEKIQVISVEGRKIVVRKIS
ncbi:MAG: nodulation protein NfeD [Alkaliphilus sp.]|nr:nodulation protein NfeD [Alkaliphilus sp.]